MLTRRDFIAGACCLLHAGPAAAAGRKERSFICGATHAPPLGWIGPSGIPLAGASFNDMQAWRVEDGATPKGDVITLDVHFMNGPKSDQRQFERIASEWTDKGLGERVRFRFGRPRAASQIRILFDPNKGYSSKVGRDNLGVPKNQPTMHLADTEHRPVLHEFGHVLGLRHEHHHPASGIVWNKPVVYRELKQQFGWSKAMVDSNIFERFTQDFSCGGEAFDKNSVMIYEIPKRWTKNGFSSRLNTTISPGDRGCLLKNYYTT
jgi:serralysin